MNFTDSNFINTSEIYTEYLEQISQEKYNEYDEYIADFEDDLSASDDMDTSFISWEDAAFDILFVLIEFLFSVPLVAGIFVLGFLFYQKPKEVLYSDMFKITMLGNFVFLAPTLVMIFWFSVMKQDYVFNDLIHFRPFYLISLLDKDSLPKWSLGFMNFINIYEVIFVLIVSYGISIKYSLRYNYVIGKIILFYATGILVWCSLWVFIKSTI